MINKIQWYLGYNSLALITEQERKHWLLKTDKKKTVIDPVTRDQYIGQIDNKGSDIMIESQKTQNTYNASLKQSKFTNNLDYIFELTPSVFTYTPSLPGLCFARIISTNYPTNTDVESFSENNTPVNEPRRKHYRIRFDDCKEYIIPFAGSDQTDDVFATRWIGTKDAYLELLDESTGRYSTSIKIEIERLTDQSIYSYGNRPYLFYPLTETLQTVPLESNGANSYHTIGITDDTLIGYPAFWINYYDARKGPGELLLDRCDNDKILWCVGCGGTDSMYNGKIYIGVDGDRNATPHGNPTSECYVSVHPYSTYKESSDYNHELDHPRGPEDNYMFVGTEEDFLVTIDPHHIYIDDRAYSLYDGTNQYITMTPNENWEFVNNKTYRIKMSAFDQNCMTLGAHPLQSIFNVDYTQYRYNFGFEEDFRTTDVGYTGIQMGSGNPNSDTYMEYPYRLNQWTGLPEWLKNMENDHVKEFMSIYALHNTPGTSASVPESRQTAALLFDLGKEQENQYRFYLTIDNKMSRDLPETNVTTHGVTLGEAFLVVTRDASYESYVTAIYGIGLANYRDSEDGQKEDDETDEDWELRTKLEWDMMSATDRKQYQPEYADWVISQYFTDYQEYGFPKYYGEGESLTETDIASVPSVRKRLRLIGSFVDATTGNSVTYDLDHPIPDEETYLEICKARIRLANQWWNDYITAHSSYYETINAIFGVSFFNGITGVSQSNFRDPSTKKFYDRFVCCDENDRVLFTINNPFLVNGVDMNNGHLIALSIVNWGSKYNNIPFSEIEERGYVDIVNVYDAKTYETYWSNDPDSVRTTRTGLQFRLTLVNEMSNVGRIYYLSNDSMKYENNRTAKFPKPERTVARICDIPTSVVQLTGISDIAPVSVVDPKYVRTECNFSKADRDRLYNQYGNRWVRPSTTTYIDETTTETTYGYVFESLEALQQEDIEHNNRYRELINVDDRIDPSIVVAGSIKERGSNYVFGDVGYIYVGGFAFTYNVLEVDNSGGVTEFSISALRPGDIPTTEIIPISLSNFDWNYDENRRIIGEETRTYGTAPLWGVGTGFKCTLQVPNVNEYVSQYGELFDDLFALVKLEDGLYLYQYDTESEDDNKWKQDAQLAVFENKSADGYHQTPTSAVISSMLPRRTTFSGFRYEDNLSPISLDILATPSFVHIVDTASTPVQMEQTADASENTLYEIDLCKLRCDSGYGMQNGFRTAQIDQRSADNNADMEKVFDTLKQLGALQYDCYLAFKWNDEENLEDTSFIYAVITRGFHNLISGGNFTLLPVNDLKYERYTNTDANTTIVWDVPNVGPMMWVFNPRSTTHEKYHIDKQRQSFYIERTTMSWDDIDIKQNDSNNKPSLFVINGKDRLIDYDIYTNSTYMLDDVDEGEVYSDPDFSKIISRGTKKEDIHVVPTGNWTCVFPRVNAFIFENDDTNTRHIPMQMQVIHSNSIGENDHIYNEETGFDESARTMIMEDTSESGVRFRVFNSETNTWDIVK